MCYEIVKIELDGAFGVLERYNSKMAKLIAIFSSEKESQHYINELDRNKLVMPNEHGLSRDEIYLGSTVDYVTYF